MIRRHLLQLAFHPRLRRVLHHQLAAPQHLRVQLSLAGAVAAHSVDVHAGLQHLRREDVGAAFVGSQRGDDVGAAHRLGHRARAHGAQAGVVPEVAHQLVGGMRVHVIQPQLINAQQMVKGDGLKLALRTVAYQRHAAAAAARQMLRRQRRGGRSAQCSGQRQFGQQQRVAGLHVCQHAKSHHRQPPLSWIAGVAIDVLEGVTLTVRNRHQLYYPQAGMAGQPGHLVKLGPATKIFRQQPRHIRHDCRHATQRQMHLKVFRAYKSQHDESSRVLMLGRNRRNGQHGVAQLTLISVRQQYRCGVADRNVDHELVGARPTSTRCSAAPSTTRQTALAPTSFACRAKLPSASKALPFRCRFRWLVDHAAFAQTRPRHHPMAFKHYAQTPPSVSCAIVNSQ